MVLDNAGYNTSHAAEKEVEDSNGALKLVFLPKYTPHLIPIEQWWNVLEGCFPAGTMGRLES